MNNDQIKELVEMFGDQLPDPKHEPKKFMYYVRLYKLIKGIL